MRQVFIIVVFVSIASLSFGQQKLKLWYEQPAEAWVEALPLGNGRIGAMVFGGVEEEVIQLNEGSLWSGGPRKHQVNPQAHTYLAPLRKALAEKDFSKATALAKKMQGHYTESYLPLGNLRIRQTFKQEQPPSQYYRELDIEHAIARTRYEQDGVNFTREVYVSAPDSVLVMKINADKIGALDLFFTLESQLRHEKFPQGAFELHMQAKAPARVDPSYYNPPGREPIIWEAPRGCDGMRVRTILHVQATDGKVQSDSVGVHVKGATNVIVFLAATTSFHGFDRCPDKEGRDEVALATRHIERVGKQEEAILRERHIQDHRSFFDRLHFCLTDTTMYSTGVQRSLPSDLRLRLYGYGQADPDLEVLYFQYGRYLLIASSRPGGTAANLQGLWNKDLRPPWSSNYTININTQMNYWPAESANLSELHRPLLDLIGNLSVTGRLTAQEYYRAKGWVAHHNTDIWGLSNAVGNMGDGDPLWANWYMGGAWLCQHLWEHYAFNGDIDYLRTQAFPIMKEAALFCLDWLVEKEGYWITSPSTSPENLFRYGGEQVSICEGATMDIAIIRDLFSNVIKASEILDTDSEFRQELLDKRSKLLPYQIGKQGQLQEWREDYEEVDPHHRHLSHLFGLHPGKDISPLTTPVIAQAAERSFALRGDGGTGWSKGWKINFAARLLNGNHAYKMIREIMRYNDPTALTGERGGTYPNFFDAHPPFQIDGNFGATAGFIEMLVQSHLGEIHLLPALPSAWRAGRMTGIKARGNFEVAVHWEDGELTSAEIKSNGGQRCVIRTEQPVRIDSVSAPIKIIREGKYYVYSFETEVGRKYTLQRDDSQ